MSLVRKTYKMNGLWLGIFLFIFGIFNTPLIAQDENVSYQYEDGMIIVSFTHLKDSIQLENLLETINCSIQDLDSLNRLSTKKLTNSGWELIKYNAEVIEFKKTLNNLEAKGKSNYFFVDENNNGQYVDYNLNVKYGVNDFKSPNLISEDENVFSFYLDNHSKAENVYLSGTFNNWSTLGLPMERENDRWKVSVKLEKGKHLYKYIVDGRWMNDPANKLKETDSQGNLNNVMFNYNYSFTFRGDSDAKKVYLAGSFNDFRPNELRMYKEKGIWKLDMYLEEGSYTYKYVVDGEWMLDPSNTVVRSDGQGNENSFMSFGRKYKFTLNTYNEAQKVILAGSFNNWNEAELEMERQYGGWTISIALKPGNYEYKYIVDGVWKLGPGNPYRNGFGDYENSLVSIEPNHTFVLEGYPDAKNVYLSGTFNGWSENGYTMEKVDDKWIMKLYLPHGKTRYKFIVDGKWIIDPDNPLWENNDKGTKDSIIWLK